jgi:hypothetical protein
MLIQPATSRQSPHETKDVPIYDDGSLQAELAADAVRIMMVVFARSAARFA